MADEWLSAARGGGDGGRGLLPGHPPGTPGLRPPCLVARPPRGAVHGRRSEPRPGARPSEGSREPGRARGPRTFRRLRSPGCGRRWASDLRPRALVGTVASKAKPRLNCMAGGWRPTISFLRKKIMGVDLDAKRGAGLSPPTSSAGFPPSVSSPLRGHRAALPVTLSQGPEWTASGVGHKVITPLSIILVNNLRPSPCIEESADGPSLPVRTQGRPPHSPGPSGRCENDPTSMPPQHISYTFEYTASRAPFCCAKQLRKLPGQSRRGTPPGPARNAGHARGGGFPVGVRTAPEGRGPGGTRGRRCSPCAEHCCGPACAGGFAHWSCCLRLCRGSSSCFDTGRLRPREARYAVRAHGARRGLGFRFSLPPSREPA